VFPGFPVPDTLAPLRPRASVPGLGASVPDNLVSRVMGRLGPRCRAPRCRTTSFPAWWREL